MVRNVRKLSQMKKKNTCSLTIVVSVLSDKRVKAILTNYFAQYIREKNVNIKKIYK